MTAIRISHSPSSTARLLPRTCVLVVALKVEDVAPHGYSADRATVRQRKTGHPVRFASP
jgi:hypothetical protein